MIRFLFLLEALVLSFLRPQFIDKIKHKGKNPHKIFVIAAGPLTD
jgi:hypothetical protein